MTKPRNTNLGLTYALLSFLIYAVSDAACKLLAQTYSTFDIRFWVSIITFGIIIAYVAKRKRVKALLYTKHPYLHIMRCALIVPIMFIIPYVLETMPLVNFYTVIFTTPMVTCFLAYALFKDKITVQTIMISLLAFIGVVIAFRPNLQTIDMPFLLCLLTVILISLLANTYRLFPKTEPKLSFILYPTIPSFIASLFFLSENTFQINFEGFMLLTIVATAIIGGVVFIVFAYEHATVSAVSVTHYSQLLWGLVFGYFFFGDLPDYYMTIGAVIVTCSGILLALTNRKRRKPKANRRLKRLKTA